MHGGADSLNTAISAALVVYEALRQRRQGAV
jgi:tRNA G18 (ribose-2'-O)-methylase SpoU